MKLRYFKQPGDFRRWLLKHHRTTTELWLGFRKKHTGQPSVTYGEALDQALAFGWIDGIRKRVDDTVYMIRFTPRRPDSIWSNVNIAHVARLKKDGVMHRSGLEVFESRDSSKAGLRSSERPSALDAPLETIFRANKTAWSFFSAQPPGYRRIGIWFVMSAKKDETRLKRLDRLISESKKNKRLI